VVRSDQRTQRRRARMLADPEQGRTAEHPGQLGRRGWWVAVMRLRDDIRDDRVSLVAAGVAFFSMLSLFPALVAAISVYGLVVRDTASVTRQIQELAGILPRQAADLIHDQLTRIAATGGGRLSLGLAASLVAALWSASAGMKALIEGVNIAYDQPEKRGFVKLRGLALLMTLGAMVLFLLAITAIAVAPALVEQLPGGGLLARLAIIGRWPVLALLALGALVVVFRYAPNRAPPRLRWVSSGALLAVVFWLLASAGFAFYADNYSRYNQTYGALGAVIVLLLWLYISAFVILVGAEFNGQLEAQTRAPRAADRTAPERGPVRG
jgi:membrane protein